MAHYGPSEDPTQPYRYGGGEPPVPWYRTPWAMFAAGVLAAVIVGLAIFAIVKLTVGPSNNAPATAPACTTTTTTTTPATTTTEATTTVPTTTEATTTTVTTTTEPTTTTTTVTVTPTPGP